MNSLLLHGRRSLELQKWRNLRVSLQNASAFSSTFSSAIAAADVISPKDGGGKGKTIKASSSLDSVRLATELTTSVSSKVRFTDEANLDDSVLKLLTSYGFTDTQISSIFRTYPQVLIANSANSLGSKLQFLQSRGASRYELTEIVTTVPKILGKRVGKTISLYYDLVKEVIEVDNKGSSKYKNSCLSLPQGNKENNIRKNILVLRELGVPQNRLLPLLFSRAQPVCGKENFDASLEMGFDPTTSIFVDALRTLYQISDKTIEEKVRVYSSVGLTVDDVWAMFRKWPLFLTHSEKKVANSIETFLGLGFSRDEFVMMLKRFPSCIGYSAELVKKKTEFLVKKMNWQPKDVASNPQVLGYSLEKRTVPRCNVIKVLMSKGLLGSEIPPITSVLTSNSQAFFTLYVRKHKDKQLVAELMAIFTGDRLPLTDQKARPEQ